MQTGKGVKAMNHPNGRTADLDDLPITLEQLDSAYIAFTENSAFRPYLDAVNGLLPSDDADDNYQINYQEVEDQVNELKFAVEADYNLTESDKEVLYIALDVFKDNLENAVNLFVDPDFEEEIPYAARGGRLKSFWRKVRSTIVTTVVFAALTFAVVASAGALAPVALQAAFIVGSLAFVGSTFDVSLNDRCWYATRCPGSSWAQECTTGNCWDPSDLPSNRPPTTVFGQIPSNPIPEDDLKKVWYNYKDVINCGSGGRCYITPGSLTFTKMHSWAEQRGIFDEVKRKFPTSSSSAQWKFYKCRLGRIFEDAAMRSLRVTAKKREVLLRTNAGGVFRPDGLELSGFEVDEVLNGQVVRLYYWWLQGAILEAKTTQKSTLCFDPGSHNYRQLTRMIDWLSENNKANMSTNRLAAYSQIGGRAFKNAARSNAAILHIVTLSGVSLPRELLQYAIDRRVLVWRSEADVVIDFFGNEEFQIRNPRVVTPRPNIEVGSVMVLDQRAVRVDWTKGVKGTEADCGSEDCE